MTFKEKAERRVVDLALTKLLKYIDKEPRKNILKLVTLGEKLLKGTFPQHYLDAIKKAAESNNVEDAKLAVHLSTGSIIIDKTTMDVISKVAEAEKGKSPASGAV